MDFDFFNGKKSAGTAFSLFICLYILLAFLGQNILLCFVNKVSFAFKFISSLFAPISLFLCCFIFYKKKKEKFFTITSVQKFNISSVVLALFILFGMFFGLGLVNFYVSKFVESVGLKVTGRAILMENGVQLACFLFSTALLPAIAEELFFRGLLSNLLGEEKSINRILFTAICFALYHTNISQLIYQFIFGIFFALIYEYSRSIVPCFICHFLNNAILILLMYLNVNVDFLLYKWYMILLGVLSLLLVAIFIINKIKNKVYSNGESVKYAYVYASFGLIFTILTLVLNMVS